MKKLILSLILAILILTAILTYLLINKNRTDINKNNTLKQTEPDIKTETTEPTEPTELTEPTEYTGPIPIISDNGIVSVYELQFQLPPGWKHITQCPFPSQACFVSEDFGAHNQTVTSGAAFTIDQQPKSTDLNPQQYCLQQHPSQTCNLTTLNNHPAAQFTLNTTAFTYIQTTEFLYILRTYATPTDTQSQQSLSQITTSLKIE